VAVVLVLACLAVLAAVVALAMGRGGELSAAHRDLPPPPPPGDHPFTGPEPFTLPRGLWGYQVEMTDEAIGRLRHALYERDVRMAALEGQVIELRRRLSESRRNDLDDPDAPDDIDDPAGSPERSPWSRPAPVAPDRPAPPAPSVVPSGATRVDLVKDNAAAGDRPGGNEDHS
jgi:hypothetical protein